MKLQIKKLEQAAIEKVYKFNRDFGLGSISYEIEIIDNSIRIYNEHNHSYINNQKELAAWLRDAKKAFSTLVD
jgi:hypothetical protein